MKILTVSDLNENQTAKYNRFVAENAGKRIVIEWHSGDPRSAYRYYNAGCRTHVAAESIGYSNGCSSARGNYHSTWAVAYEN